MSQKRQSNTQSIGEILKHNPIPVARQEAMQRAGTSTTPLRRPKFSHPPKTNIINYCLVNNYKLQIRFKPGHGKGKTFKTLFAWPVTTTYSQFLSGFVNCDYKRAMQKFKEYIEQLNGQLLAADIYENRGEQSEIVVCYRYLCDIEKRIENFMLVYNKFETGHPYLTYEKDYKVDSEKLKDYQSR